MVRVMVIVVGGRGDGSNSDGSCSARAERTLTKDLRGEEISIARDNISYQLARPLR